MTRRMNDNSGKHTPRFQRGDRVVLPDSGGQVGTVVKKAFDRELWRYRIQLDDGTFCPVMFREFDLKSIRD
jgi:hypothetical protein